VSPLPSSPPRKDTKGGGRRSPPAQGRTVALNPSAKPIEASGAKRRRAVRPAGGDAEARERVARTFADVLSGRFGGRWAVEWEGADRSPQIPSRDVQSGEK
jgi:hypothetical protein